MARRRAPLVSQEAVRRWAATVGLVVGEGPLDRRFVDLYVERLRSADGRLHDEDPGACPWCGRPGFIDHVDIPNATQTRHCSPCSVSWVIALDIDAQGAAQGLAT